MKHHAIKQGPIQKNFTEDIYSKPITIERGLTSHKYELFLYDELKVGSKPKYKVVGFDKDKILRKANIVCDAYNLKMTGVFNSVVVTDINYCDRDNLEIINIETGELIE